MQSVAERMSGAVAAIFCAAVSGGGIAESSKDPVTAATASTVTNSEARIMWLALCRRHNGAGESRSIVFR
jgi:hypothetical protein